MSAVHTPMPSDLLVHGWQAPGAVCGHAAPEASPGAAPEVADIFRAYGDAYRATHRLSGQQLRVMQAIETCRTAALGGHLAQCDWCGAQIVRYHSCGNRHCPKCQTLAKLRWVQARLAELLDIPYFHCVLTLPHTLNPLPQGLCPLHCRVATARLGGLCQATLRRGRAGGLLLGRYTHRVAISNHRLVAVREGQVAFRWRDYRHGNRVKVMTLAAGEFIRRFLLHTLSRGWVR